MESRRFEELGRGMGRYGPHYRTGISPGHASSELAMDHALRLGLSSRRNDYKFRHPMTNLLIEYLTLGNGESPQPGHRVSVHYTGWLTDGTKFDSSVDRGEPFEFVLGQGQVIRGWDEGVARMRVGDKAKLTLPPDFAYGDGGYPGAIPARATLIFEVQLLKTKKA